MQHKITTEEIEALRHAARMVVRELGLLTDAYFDIGITLAERHLLIEIESALSPDAREIAKRLLLDKSTVSRLVAKAVKKGFISYTVDKNDKRRRFLQLTEKGKQTLNAIEPLAQKQVKNALLTLNEAEVHTVQQGVAFFAKGLGKARLGKDYILELIAQQDKSLLAHPVTSIPEDSEQSIYSQFKKRGYTLELYSEEDQEGLYEIFQEVVEAGTNFPHEASSREEFQNCFFSPKSSVFVCRSTEEVIGAFYLKPNFPGRGDHIANAAYMIRHTARSKGLGKLLGKASLLFAKKLGFQAIQLNIVLSQNLVAVNLYKKLGFNIIGTIPQAIRNPDNSYQAGYIMHQSL